MNGLELRGDGKSVLNSDLEVKGNLDVVNSNAGSLVGTYEYVIDYKDFDTDLFYPVVLHQADHYSIDGGVFPSFEFEVFCPNQGYTADYNSQSIKGFVRTGGWGDHGNHYSINCKMFDQNERSILQILRSKRSDVTIGIYLRGGSAYSIRTNAVVELMTDIDTNGIRRVTQNSTGSDYCVRNLSGEDSIRGVSGIQESLNVDMVHEYLLVQADSIEQNGKLIATEGATILGTTELETLTVNGYQVNPWVSDVPRCNLTFGLFGVMNERGAISDEDQMMSHGSVLSNDYDNTIAFFPTPFKMRVVGLSFATDGDDYNSTTPVANVTFLPLKKKHFHSPPEGATEGAGTDDEMRFPQNAARSDGTGTFKNMMVVEAGERWGIQYIREVISGKEVDNEISVRVFCEQL